MNSHSAYLDVDANALIEAMESPSLEFLALLQRLKDKGIDLISGELSLAEVLPVPLRRFDIALVAIYEDLLGQDGLISVVPVSRNILRMSADVRARLGGKLPDAIHVATAILGGCTVIVSSDKRLRLPNGLRRVSTRDAALLEES